MQPILTRHNVSDSGDGGPPLLFAHGFGCDQHIWRHVTPAFSPQYRTILFDYVGHGCADGACYDRERYSTLEGYATDILDICDALALSDIVLVGHSVSGVIAMLAAIRQPERFRQLVLVCPSPRYLNDAPDYHGGFEAADLSALLDLTERNPTAWASSLAPIVMQNSDRPELANELERRFCAVDPEVARDFARVTFYADNRDDVSRVTVPTAVMQTSHDVIAPPSVGRFFEHHLPQGTLWQLQATGHCPQLSHPEEFCETLRTILRTP